MLRLSFPRDLMSEGTSDRPAPEQGSAAAPRSWIRDSLLICLGLKALLLFFGVVVAEVRLDKPFRTIDDVFGIWHQWDSRHYYDIAANGYKKPEDGTTLVLPPLLPML